MWGCLTFAWGRALGFVRAVCNAICTVAVIDRTLYILDEPTTGLHFADIALLLKVLLQLRDAGNTIIVIEHNLDVIKTADWIVDMGPEGGAGGGRVVACGTPEKIAAHPDSHTGRYLAHYLNKKTH